MRAVMGGGSNRVKMDGTTSIIREIDTVLRLKIMPSPRVALVPRHCQNSENTLVSDEN